jgi:hypothetical protein
VDLLAYGSTLFFVESAQRLFHGSGSSSDIQRVLGDIPRYARHVRGTPRKNLGVRAEKVDEHCFLFIDVRLRLRREVNARRVPRWGASAVDSLDSRRGVASCLAMAAPPPSPSAVKVTGQTRMLLFRHVGKTSSILPPASGLTAAIVVVARRRKECHVVAAVEGHELKTPEMEQCPGLERLLETTHLELDGKLFINTQRAPTWRANCRRFDPGGSLDRRVNCRCLSQPRWVGARQNTRGETVRGNRGLVLSCAQGGCAYSRGLQVFARGREREREPCASARSPARPPSRTRALDLPFIDVKKGPRCTMGGVAMC